jgi:hypothetical protein
MSPPLLKEISSTYPDTPAPSPLPTAAAPTTNSTTAAASAAIAATSTTNTTGDNGRRNFVHL